MKYLISLLVATVGWGPVYAGIFIQNKAPRDAFIIGVGTDGERYYSQGMDRFAQGECGKLHDDQGDGLRPGVVGYVLLDPANVMGTSATGYAFRDPLSRVKMPFNTLSKTDAMRWDRWLRTIRGIVGECPSEHCRYIPVGNPSKAYQYEITGDGDKLQFVEESFQW